MLSLFFFLRGMIVIKNVVEWWRVHHMGNLTFQITGFVLSTYVHSVYRPTQFSRFGGQ